MSEDKTDKQIEILLSFYNGVQGNLDIRHGYPPINMTEAHAKITQLLLEERLKQMREIFNSFGDKKVSEVSKVEIFDMLVTITEQLEAALKEVK